jgi:hypothetical protein
MNIDFDLELKGDQGDQLLLNPRTVIFKARSKELDKYATYQK